VIVRDGNTAAGAELVGALEKGPAVVNRSVAVEIDPTGRWQMGAIRLLEFQRVLARLHETYIAAVDRDYWVY
jgi:hypothetical protein